MVGVDGSDGAAGALHWAMQEAPLHGASIVAVMAWGYLDQHHPREGTAFDPAYGEPEAAAALDEAIEAAVGTELTVPVERRVVCDLAPAALVGAAGPDDVLAVGARGFGGFAGLLLGSVSRKILAEARCPVAVVRPRDNAAEPAPIVVGVDGSAVSRGALVWAVEEGRARGAQLRAVHGWTAPFVDGYPFGAASFDPRLFEGAGQTVLDEALAEVDTSGVDIDKVLAYGTGGATLLEAAEGADLIVVGTRGTGGIKSWLLGSVSHQVVQHAPCTVVVVPVPH